MANVPTICTRCAKRLGPNAVRAAGMQFHPQCFVCDFCKKSLSQSFVPKGQGQGQRLYHPECHEKLFVPRCAQCGESIQGAYSRDAAGRYHPDCYTQLHNLVCSLCSETIRGSYVQDHWGNKAHTEHAGQPTGLCHVCARLISPTHLAGGRQLEDGRLLCGGCHGSEIRDFAQIQQAKLEVIKRMQAVGFAYIPDYVKVELSPDQQLLNERMRASATGNIHGFTRTARRLIPGYGEMLEHSISVLSGLPRVAFMGVLAHELLHVWIHEQNLAHLSHAEVEGFCNLGTALMLQAELAGPDGPLARVLLARMDEDPDPAYGDGYRAMAWRLAALGWPALIAALKDAGTPLAQPAAEILRPREPEPSMPEKPVPAPAKAPGAATAAANERLQALKHKLQNVSQSAASSAPRAASGAPPASPTPVSGPSSEIADKVRERFARPAPKPMPKPGQKPGGPAGSGGGKLGKLKK